MKVRCHSYNEINETGYISDDWIESLFILLQEKPNRPVRVHERDVHKSLQILAQKCKDFDRVNFSQLLQGRHNLDLEYKNLKLLKSLYKPIRWYFNFKPKHQ